MKHTYVKTTTYKFFLTVLTLIYCNSSLILCMNSKITTDTASSNQLVPFEQKEPKLGRKKKERLIFAAAIKDYEEKNTGDVIDILLNNAFQFLPIKNIKKIRLTNKNACLVMDNLLKQSIHAIAIGSRPQYFPIQNNDRFFFLRFSHMPKPETSEEISKRTNFIHSMTLNTYMLFFEIDMNRFSKKSFDNMIEACNKPEILKKLSNVFCLLSRIKNDNKKANWQCLKKITDFSSTCNFDVCFNYIHDNKSLTKINTNITDFYNKNNTLKKINVQDFDYSIIKDTSLEKYYKTFSKNRKTVKIELDCNTFKKAEQAPLIQNLFNNTLFPNMKKIDISSYNEDFATSIINKITEDFPEKKNKSISTLKINNSMFRRMSLEVFLEKLKNLKTLVLNNCYVDECFYEFELKKNNYALEKIITRWTDDEYSDDDEEPTIFFSVNSLKGLIARCPNLHYISLQTLQIDEDSSTFDDLFSYIKELSARLDYMYFDIVASDATITYMEEKPEDFEQKINNLTSFLKSKNFDVEITKREDYGCSGIEFAYPLCIKIVKNQ